MPAPDQSRLWTDPFCCAYFKVTPNAYTSMSASRFLQLLHLADSALPVEAAAHIDVAGGDKIPRKGGSGVTRSSSLVINKIDLAEHVGASLEVMDRDSKKMRGPKPFLFTDLKHNVGLASVLEWLSKRIEQADRRSLGTASEPGELAHGKHTHSHSH